jgi:membrane protein YdbS with pleckstrin-like domain
MEHGDMEFKTTKTKGVQTVSFIVALFLLSPLVVIVVSVFVALVINSMFITSCAVVTGVHSNRTKSGQT